MKKKVLILYSILMILTMMLDKHTITFSQEQSLPFTVEPIYPQNHNIQTKGYFDLFVKPGEKQTIQVRVTNNENKETTISIKSADAYTNPVGGIMYDVNIESPNTALLKDNVRLSKYLQVGETITVPPLTSIEVPIQVSVPDINVQTMLGGIIFTRKGDESRQQENTEEGTANFIINTETNIAIAVQLNVMDKEEQSNFSVGEAGFLPETSQVYIEMVNDAYKIQEDIAGNYEVINEQGHVLFEGQFGPFNMAPKTKIRFPIQWGNETVEDGDYNITVDGSIAGRKINQTIPFKIGVEDIEKFVEKNQRNLPEARVEEDGMPIWVWVVGIALFGIIMFLVGRKKSNT